MMNDHPQTYWWKCLTPEIMASVSLSNWEYCFSAAASDLEANAMGLSEPSFIRCDSTASSPYSYALIEVDEEVGRFKEALHLG